MMKLGTVLGLLSVVAAGLSIASFGCELGECDACGTVIPTSRTPLCGGEDDAEGLSFYAEEMELELTDCESIAPAGFVVKNCLDDGIHVSGFSVRLVEVLSGFEPTFTIVEFSEGGEDLQPWHSLFVAANVQSQGPGRAVIEIVGDSSVGESTTVLDVVCK